MSIPSNAKRASSSPSPFLAKARKTASLTLASPYLSLALVIAWHYSLWFVPNATGFLGITSFDVTFTWLLTLGFTGAFLLGFPFFLRGIDTGNHRLVVPCSAAALFLSTLAFCLATPLLEEAARMTASALIACIFGMTTALIWIFCGASCLRARAPFSVRDIAPVFAFATVTSMFISMLLPTIAAAVFASALPIASALAYRRTMRSAEGCPAPVPLPRESSKSLTRSAITLCVAGGILSLSDTFAISIIPSEMTGVVANADILVWSLAGGVVAISAVILLYASRCREWEPYSLIPILMALSIVALSFAIQDEPFAAVAFGLGMGICVILEVLLLAFFGALATRGYLAPAVAFGLAEGIPRLGDFIGNACSVALEQASLVDTMLVQDVCLALICVIGFLIITATRQQHAIVRLTSSPLSSEEIETVCNDAAAEFGLSPRESEILKLLARNCSIDLIASKLVISPYTVQTHVQHIYRKLQVHRRSELLDYINLRRETPKSNGRQNDAARR